MSIENNIQRIADALEAFVKQSATNAELLQELLASRPTTDAAAEAAGQAVEKASRRSRKPAADTTPAPDANAAAASTPAAQPDPTPAPQPEATPAPSVADCQAKAAALSAKIGSGPVLALISESGCAKISAMTDEQRVKFFAGMANLDQPSAANAFD